MKNLLLSFAILFVSFTNLLADNFNKKIEGTWYYNISMPVPVDEEEVTMIMKGSQNFMFNHKTNSIIEFSLKFKDEEEIPIFIITSMSSWEIQNNILLEEILKVNIITEHTTLNENPELKALEDMMSKMYYKGLSSTSHIKSITNDIFISESDGIEVISTRKSPLDINITNNINK